MIQFNRPSIVGNEIRYIKDAVKRGQLSGDGYYTSKCNKRIEEITCSKKALITHSCTAALEMAAILCNLEPGDEVILPSYTFVSTANAIVLRGATPVFVDIDQLTLNISPQEIEKAITAKTKAVFVVHYAGFPADMDEIRDICAKNNLIVVEDAAQALGSVYKGKSAGSLGDLAAFSFHETKNLISGEGGALTINNDKFVERAEIIREKGTNRSKFFRGQVDKYTWVDVGSSYLPGELIAAYLYGQLEVENAVRDRRNSIYNHYIDEFKELGSRERVKLPYHRPYVTGNGHMFYLIMQSQKDRSQFIKHMKENGITTPFHYVPLHSAPAGVKFSRAHGDLTVTNNVSETLVRLPMYYDLGNDIERVLEVAFSYFNAHK